MRTILVFGWIDVLKIQDGYVKLYWTFLFLNMF